MTSVNFKVIGLTRPGFEPAGSRLKSARYGFPDLPVWDTLLIQHPSWFFRRGVDYSVVVVCMCRVGVCMGHTIETVGWVFEFHILETS